MSNRYNGKILVIDTTDTQIGGEDATGGPKGHLSIKAIKWVSTAASTIDNDDDLIIEWAKNGGDICISAKADVHTTANSHDYGAVHYSVEFGGSPWIVPGLYIEDLDGGELQVFLD